METSLGREVYLCQDCKLLSNLPDDEEYTYWTLPNGMSMNLGNGSAPIPFHSQIVPCEPHRILLEAAYPE